MAKAIAAKHMDDTISSQTYSLVTGLTLVRKLLSALYLTLNVTLQRFSHFCQALLTITFLIGALTTLPTKKVFAQDLVLTLRPDSAQFHQVSQGIEESLAGDIEMVDMVVGPGKDNRLIFDWITLNRPNAIILMDNYGVNTYLAYQRQHPARRYPPSIIVSTLAADRMIPLLANSSAILYEVPAVTSLVGLRKMMVNRPIKKVGTIYRSDFKQTFLTQRKFSSLEQIELLGIEVPNDASSRALKKALKALKKSETDAIWIMNDPALLTKSLITRAWIPQLKKHKQPVVVGIKTLINSELALGDYATYPDHYELGIQVGDKLFDLQDNRWQLENNAPLQPISISKEVNIWRLNRKGIRFQQSLLNEFERIITE